MKTLAVRVASLAASLVVSAGVGAQVNFQVIHDFDGVNGQNAPGHLVYHDGRLYGMTAGDSLDNLGVIFSLLPDGSDFRVIHYFSGRPHDGEWPHGSLGFFNDRLYGLTWAGGCALTHCPNFEENGCGAAFSLQTDGGNYTILWKFSCGGSEDLGAALPNAHFVSDGEKLYSTTQAGGDYGDGTVFSMKPDGTEFTVLHSFNGAVNAGRQPSAGLALDGDVLYGTTPWDGLSSENDRGTIFSVRTDGTDFSIVHTFNKVDGKIPFCAPTIAGGRIFGTASHRGVLEDHNGVVFSINTDGSDYVVLHYFSPEDGYPMEGVTLAGDSLYGATLDSGPLYFGVVYSVKTDGSDYTVLHRFDNEDGSNAYGKLLLAGNTFYGMAASGGAAGCGAIFSFQLPAAPENPVIQSGDYDGDGRTDIAVFRPASGLWAVRGLGRTYFGQAGDIPVSGDYNGDGRADVSIFRPSSGLWAVKGATRLYFGGSDDTPVPADYDGDGRCDVAVFGQQSGRWMVRGITSVYYGTPHDRPVPGDYTGDGSTDIAIFRPASGLWAVRGITRCYFGAGGDIPAPGVFKWYGVSRSTGPFRDRVAVFRPLTGLWAIKGVSRFYFGSAGDSPVIGDFDGNALDDIAIFRPVSGLWAIRENSREYFGTSGDIPVAR